MAQRRQALQRDMLPEIEVPEAALPRLGGFLPGLDRVGEEANRVTPIERAPTVPTQPPGRIQVPPQPIQPPPERIQVPTTPLQPPPRRINVPSMPREPMIGGSGNQTFAGGGSTTQSPPSITQIAPPLASPSPESLVFPSESGLGGFGEGQFGGGLSLGASDGGKDDPSSLILSLLQLLGKG